MKIFKILLESQCLLVKALRDEGQNSGVVHKIFEEGQRSENQKFVSRTKETI